MKSVAQAFSRQAGNSSPTTPGSFWCATAKCIAGTFASAAAYLQRAPPGLAAGDVWPCDLGLDLSRGFRALKTWFTFQVHGADKIGRAIEASCENACYLAESLSRSESFELRAPVCLNIVPDYALASASDLE